MLVATYLGLIGCMPPLAPPTAHVEYDRELYLPSKWADLDGNGCDTRADLLATQSLVAVTMDSEGCRVTGGLWVDFYTGEQWRDSDDVQVDHVIALADAHDKGAWRMTPTEKSHFANDYLNLVVTSDNLNASKGERGPLEWDVPGEGTCDYAERYRAVMEKYTLDWEDDEKVAIDRQLERCE